MRNSPTRVAHSFCARGALVLAVLNAACATDRVAAAPADFPVQLVVSNKLIAPVTVSIDGTPSLGLRSDATSLLTVSSRSQWLTWTSAKPLDARGQQIPDEIGEVRISISGINGVMEITNVIDDQTYITARILNQTNAPVSIGVYDGSSVSCAAELPAAFGEVSGFTQIGYYRLQPATEVRAYRDPSGCTGSYVAWPSAQVRSFAAKSGLLNLSLDSAP